jgi:hypothetical protein
MIVDILVPYYEPNTVIQSDFQIATVKRKIRATALNTMLALAKTQMT